MQRRQRRIQSIYWTLWSPSPDTVWSLDFVMWSLLDLNNLDGVALSLPHLCWSDGWKTWLLNNAPLHIYPGHIPSLIKADMLDPSLTRLVAVNSIYFKGLWKSCFQPENTKMRPFTSGSGNVYPVPMMSQLSVFNIGEPRCMGGSHSWFSPFKYL